jgi:hypothetical protein
MERVIGIEPTTFSLGTGIWGLGGRYVGARFSCLVVAEGG